VKSSKSEIDSFSIIGAGRMGSALAAIGIRVGLRMITVVDIDQEKATRIRNRYGGMSAVNDVSEMNTAADIIFIAVPDDTIQRVASALTRLNGGCKARCVVHTSGLQTAEALSTLRQQKVLTGSFHPCYSFHEAFDDPLHGITIAIEGDPELLPLLERLAERMGANPVRVHPENKPLYHAVCTLASGGLIAWLSILSDLMGRIADHGGLDWILPLIKGTLKHAEEVGVQNALTGPVVRGDLGTIQHHIEILEKDASDVLPLYLDLTRRSMHIASEKAFDQESLRELQTLVDRYRPQPVGGN
jgi:predicted short-subunit dehydrogenase-like oxidoreductase (DUF2520 family)